MKDSSLFVSVRLGRLLFALVIAINIYGKSAFSEELDKSIFLDFQTHIHYWAFNGPTNKDDAAIEDLLNSASALSESLGLGSRDEIKLLMQNDVNAQGGPQLLLALKTIPLIEAGIKSEKYSPVSRFIDSISRVNSQLGGLARSFVNFTEHKSFDVKNDLILSPQLRTHCLLTCVSKFLALEKNSTFQYFIGVRGIKPPSGLQAEREIAQIQNRFPNENVSQKPTFRTGIDPRLASTSRADSECVSSCIREVSGEAFKWGGAFAAGSYALGGPQAAFLGGLAGGAIGAGVGLGICSFGSACSGVAQKEVQNKEKKNELDSRENALRESELNAREQAHKEQLERDRKQREEQVRGQKKLEDEVKKKEQQVQEEKKIKDEQAKAEQKSKHDEIEREIAEGSWADPSKNKDARSDSSVSCEASRICDGTMDALVEKDFDKERKSFDPFKDGSQRSYSSTPIREMDRENAPSRSISDYLNQKNINTLDRSKDWAPKESTADLVRKGKIISNWSKTSTPMPISK